MHDGLLISVGFWGCFALYLIVDRGLQGLLPSAGRHQLNVVASAAFLWYFTAVGALHLAALYVGLTVLYFAARAALRPDSPSPIGGRLLLLVGAVTTLWALGKIGSSLDLSHFGWLFFLGASFLLVKVWTFCKDLSDGRIAEPRWLTFLSYCTFFPCFISGPMHYYGEFRESFEERSAMTGEVLVNGVFRILHGLVKVLILGVALRPFSLDALGETGLSEIGLVELLARSVVYSLVIYLDFSGYSDIAIAAGALLGVKVPENFRLPYLARNLRDFWQSWHITFTRFLTQYLFVPFVRLFQRRFVGASAAATSATAYLATFLFCGFWHGSTLNYLAWGLYHGIGLAAHDYYRQRRLAAARAARRAPSVPSKLNHSLFALITFLFVSLGWILFTLPLGFWME